MTTRDRLIAVAVAAVAALAAYWFLLLAPKREEAAAVAAQVTRKQEQLDSSLSRVAAALEARKSYASNYANVARLGQAVPAEDNVPSLVFQLDSAARVSGVDFRAVKLTGGQGSAGSSGSGSTSSSTASSATGAPATQAASATLPPGASVGPAGFPTMPFTFTFDGSFYAMSDFFRRLERFVDTGGERLRVGGRLLTLDGIGLTASRKGFPRVKATITATAYLLPADEGATGGGSAASPASTAAPGGPAAGAGSSSTPTATVAPPLR